MQYVVDTNVISELVKKERNYHVVEWIKQNDTNLNITAITIEEMKFGALLLPEGKRKNALVTAIDILLETYSSKTWAFDAQSAEICARLHQKAIANGRTPSIEDLMIAAITLGHEATLVTRNVKDFDYLNVPLVNPFKENDSKNDV